MKHYQIRLGPALIALAALSLGSPAAAETIDFTASLSGQVSAQFLPLNPPQQSVAIDHAFSPRSTFGPFLYTAHHIVRMGVTGPGPNDMKPNRFTEGTATVDWLNGDSIFISYSGIIQAGQTPGV